MYGAQNIPQCQNRYPDKEWAEIMGAMDIQLMLGCSDDVTAEYFSLRSGDMTVEVNSTMTVRQTLAVAQMIPHYRYTEGIGRRRLLTPDEVLRLPNDELLDLFFSGAIEDKLIAKLANSIADLDFRSTIYAPFTFTF